MSRRLLIAWCVLHLLVIATISGREIVWVLARGVTIFPATFSSFWKKTERVTSAVMGEGLPFSHPVRQAFSGYEHLAGIEAGYGYFAPNATDSPRLVFEIHYPDGRTEYDLPSVGSHAAGLRFTSLLDKIRLTGDDSLRELMIKMLVYANWQEHPDATKITAIFGEVILPGIDEFEQGERERFQIMYTYQFEKQQPPERKSSG